MITFFTTTKNFANKDFVNQVNAIKSWTLGTQYNCEAIIFQKNNEVRTIAELPNVSIVNNVRSNESGIPFISEMFYRASKLAKHNIVCFINADIIVNDLFVKYLIDIHEQEEEKYLVVGKRIDTSFDFLINFEEKDWFETLMALVSATATTHPALGSDYFAFPKGQYILNKLPDLLVGRPGWDLFMIYNARKNHFRLIDLSCSFIVLHQNHDYRHKSQNQGVKVREDRHNYNYLPKGEEYKYLLNYCNYSYSNGRVVKTYHNYDFSKYYKQEIDLYNPSRLKKVLIRLDIFCARIIHNLRKAVNEK